MGYRKGGGLDERAALKEESARRKAARQERDTRIRAHAAANPDLNMRDIARAFNVQRTIVEAALGKRAH